MTVSGPELDNSWWPVCCDLHKVPQRYGTNLDLPPYGICGVIDRMISPSPCGLEIGHFGDHEPSD